MSHPKAPMDRAVAGVVLTAVIGVACHSETEEEMVVCRKEYDDQGLWVRPLAMFIENVEVKGLVAPRFKLLGSE